MNRIRIIAIAVMTLIAVPAAFPAATSQAQEQKNLTIFIWSEYMDPEIISNFEKLHGVKVRLDYYESNEEMITKLQTGRQGTYDVIVPSTYFIPTLVNLDLIQPLDYSLIPNAENIDGEFRNLEVDPDDTFTVPYQWGTSGLAVRVPEGTEVDPSWDLVFKHDPKLGNFLLFDTARDSMCSALKFLGFSANTVDLAEIEKAGILLAETKSHKNFMGFDSGMGGLTKVMAGVASLAQVYSGEAIKASKEDPEIRYIIPKEGCEIWVDLLAIPKGATNVKVAHEFLNYILEPEVGAKLASFNNYATPNKASLALIPKEDLENPGMYPPKELKDKMEYMRDLGEANRLYDE
ncbi:MAG: spermidine/putrescine ABC transporter substrate-binding protein, partial [Deltaproteobacteria bacterium]|nr:spermidine/putrescine ABC transporter substrate-binding protein [Deltaproteobacteria bacterium]